ncbi:chromosome segregation protein SMC [Caldilinea sp.]|uniref:chromosome segregation protein SMC n=2 Tax=Caldilinea TaxID=233191 RepID=UPI0021DBA3DB|nr:chromosome segregation protein SMC [Caldilinea sp.]GIV69004.1 MAG: chromosome partition protein Smc [Caldilinea sp.]
MRIKRVVIQGFKTFARRTEFIFDPGVTAVVGPNGSGKSNIVDAIRWCLGEQSFSLLRSRKTSDVIFSGSDKKSRLNLAEVTITLDNSQGEAPLDYAEIEITRRAYRDGDNEYLLNGQRVRLQDIIDILAPTGLGKRTYSVIGQGLIDRALSMAPEERRSLFEEAAGISGYQIKRATAVRRLEATQQNLTRVRDILAELSPRLGYLRRQAERAREREQIARDLQALLREWYGYRWHATLRMVEQHHAAEAAQRREVADRQQQLAAIGAAIAQLRQAQGEARAQLATLHAESSELHRQAEATARDLAVAQERLRQLQARSEDATRELAPLDVQRTALAERLEELRRNVEKAEDEVRKQARLVEETQNAVGVQQEARSRLAAQQETLRRTLTQRQRRRAEIAGLLEQIAERSAALEVERSQQQQALVEARRAQATAEAALAEAEKTLQTIEQEAHAHQSEIAVLEAEISALQQEQRNAENARQEADRTLERLKTRQDLLQRLQREGAGYAGGVRAVLQAQANGRLRGVLGTVAAQLRVPPHLDKAIETALGAALQNVITQSWEDAAAAIELLKEQRSGRATFLPLDRLHVQPPIPAPKRSGILGLALELVDYAPAVEAAMQQLLNRVWVAETLAAARAALDAYRGNARPTVVTLEGEIIRPGGAVTGGSEGGRGDDSLLARERELRELPGQIERASALLRERAEACSKLAGEIETKRIEITRRQQALAELARRERQLRGQLEELRRQVDRSVQMQRWRSEQMAQADAEWQTLVERRAALDAEATEVERQEQESLQALGALEAELQAADADALLQELANRRAAEAEAQGHLRSQQALLESTRRTLQDVELQMRNKEQQIAALNAEMETLRRRIELLTRTEETLSAQIEALQQRIAPVEQTLHRLEAQQAEEEQRERAQQQALRQAESHLNQALLQLQRSEDALQQLRSEIEADLGLVLLEESADVAYQPPLPWDAVVQQLPVVESAPESLEAEVREMRARLARLGGVNPEAPREYEEAAERFEFLSTQSQDLEAASADLQKVIRELDDRMEIELRRTFEAVGKEFTRFFQQLFNGGTAHLELTEPDNISQSGVEIIARPPGKRPQSLALLSGGERALAACALIFAILRVSPTPFCVLDEVDAALDEANVDRFRLTVEELSRDTQFIIVTHNRRTLEGANAIYGVTMGADGVSRVISLRLEGDRIVKSDGASDAVDLRTFEEEIQM